MDNQFGKHDETRCRYCGGKLSLLQRLSRHDFCSPDHRQAFQREQEELALARLQMALDPGTPALEPLAEEALMAPDPVVEAAPQIAEPEPAGGFEEEVFAEEETPGYGRPLLVHPPAVAAQFPCQDDSFQAAEGYGTTAYPSLQFGAPERYWAPAGGSPNLHALVRPAAGDLLTIFVLPPAEEPREPGCRLPELELERSGWKQIAEREQQKRSEPPMAGLVPIKGPQTLRVVIGPQKPEAEPEHPVAHPSMAVPMPAAARTAGPRMGGVRAFRTRIGTAGSVRPQSGGSDEPIEAHGDIAPALPRMSGAGLAGGAIGKARADAEKGGQQGEAALSSGLGAGGSGDSHGDGVGNAAGVGGTGQGDLRMDGSQIPVAGYCSLGGGPLDREAGPRACGPFLSPYDLAGIRALLDLGLYERLVEIESFAPREPEAALPAIPRAMAGEDLAGVRPGVPVSSGAMLEVGGALPSGGVIPGYRLINLISVRLPAPRHRSVVQGSPDRAEAPKPRPASVSLPLPRLGSASCEIGFVERPGVRDPKLEADSLEPSVSGAPRVWRASGAAARAPRLGYGWLEGLEVWAVGGRQAVQADEDAAASLGPAGVEAVKPVRPARAPVASVPVYEERLFWQAKPKDLLAEPDLQAIGCSFASGGGLWDSLT